MVTVAFNLTGNVANCGGHQFGRTNRTCAGHASCEPHFCNNNNYGARAGCAQHYPQLPSLPRYDSCYGHSGRCGGNRLVNWNNYDLTFLTAAHANLLLSIIRSELDRHNLSNYYSLTKRGSNVNSATTIQAAHINNMETMVEDGTSRGSTLGPGDCSNTSKATYYTGNLFVGNHWSDLYGKYVVFATGCVCNSNCNCNAVCACHVNCGCNYA